MSRALIFSAAASLAASVAIPEQIHISFTGRAGEMAVDFVAHADQQSVNYTVARSADAETAVAAADCQLQTLNSYEAYWCTALMTSLTANAAYTYQVGGAGAVSAKFTFVNEPSARLPIFAVYADFGYGNDESLGALIKDAQAGGFDFVVHAGDWAYDLDSANSATGNAFMNSIQPYAATVPYMGSPGNHEAYGTQGGGAFAQYVLRNRALAENAGKNSGSNSNVYYSFKTPLTHWLAFTAETWTMSAPQLAAQTAFIAADLGAVDRAATPWVASFSHKAFQMDQTTWALFDFLAEYKVDLQFVGHWHQYTRFAPLDTRGGKVVVDYDCMSDGNHTYTNAKYPTIIVTGATGNVEVDPASCSEAHEINCSGNYGYGHFQTINATAAHWLWNTTVPVKGSADPRFADELWLIKA